MEQSLTEQKKSFDPDNVFGYVHSVETCGTVDGPGIRYVVFMQGCPMRCQYCHNPDTWDPKGKNSKRMSVRELMDDIIKYKSFMHFSNGGVTVSGGEPLMQPEFVKTLFKACKEEGISTALDTSGFCPIDSAKEVLNYTDLMLLDIKSYNPDTFKEITEREISHTLSIAQYASENAIPMWIRFVLVPGLSDNYEDIEKLAEYVSSLSSVQAVEVLPFHKMGEYKWQELGYDYKLTDTPEPQKESIEKARELFRAKGLAIH
jgi:pyruvate formate lyase activating enzyme